MKKFVLAFVLLFGLSGCGQKVDYLNPKTYTDFVYNEINKVNSEYIPTAQKYFDEIGLSKAGTKINEFLQGLVNKDIADMTNREAKKYYRQFKRVINKAMKNGFTEKIQNGFTKMTEKLNDNALMKATKEKVENIKKFVIENKDKAKAYIQKITDKFNSAITAK